MGMDNGDMKSGLYKELDGFGKLENIPVIFKRCKSYGFDKVIQDIRGDVIPLVGPDMQLEFGGLPDGENMNCPYNIGRLSFLTICPVWRCWN